MDTILYFYQKRNNADDNKNLHINKHNIQLICEEIRYEFTDFEVIHLALSHTAAYLLGMTDNKAKIKAKREEKLKNEINRLIAAYWEKEYNTYWVCTEKNSLPERLKFDDYTAQIWIDRLLSQAKHPDYIIIGTGADIGIGKGIAELLLRRARRIRNLTIYITQKDYDYAADDMEELETVLYEEYGLAVRVTLIQNSRYRGISLEEMSAANILDMTAEETLPCINVPEGSRWFDLSCSSDKKRKAENCLKNVSYYSVNEMFVNPWKWKTARFP